MKRPLKRTIFLKILFIVVFQYTPMGGINNFMCGIVGYSSYRQDAQDVLLHGLSTLEYRGYDSSGIAFFASNNIQIIKSQGKVSRLQERVEKNPIQSCCGIAHTRWATHGEPNETNAHPHHQGHVTLVHNGIIENYHELSKQLEAQGYHFQSETDTEVACACIDAAYKKTGDPLAALQLAKEQLKGSYAFAILFDEYPNTVYAMRYQSPLIVAKNEYASFIASDIPALLAYTRSYVVLDQKEVAVLKGNQIQLFDAQGNEKEPVYQTTTMDVQSIQKCGYDHFMLKEIHEEPEAVKETLQTFERDGILSNIDRPFTYDRYAHIMIIACGSAYHAGMIAKELIESEARMFVQVDVASEFRYRNPMLDPQTLVILVSQSGETADTLAALKLAKERNIDTLAIVNVVGSSLAREADFVAYTMAKAEIAVATTKAYATQVTLLAYIALQLASLRGHMNEERKQLILAQLHQLPDFLSEILENGNWEESANVLAGHEHVFFIGRGLDHALCMEGSLKLKEISYIHSEAYPAGELKHGTISLIEEGTPVIAIATEPQLFDKTISNIREVKARGAKVILVCRDNFRVHKEVCDIVIPLPPLDRMIQAVLTVLPLQLIAYRTAVLRGCEIDKPRNLAKSVTVE